MVATRLLVLFLSATAACAESWWPFGDAHQTVAPADEPVAVRRAAAQPPEADVSPRVPAVPVALADGSWSEHVLGRWWTTPDGVIGAVMLSTVAARFASWLALVIGRRMFVAAVWLSIGVGVCGMTILASKHDPHFDTLRSRAVQIFDDLAAFAATRDEL